MHFSIFSPNSNSPAKCPNRLGTLPAFRTYAMQYRYICGQTQIVVLKNSICYIDVPTVPLLSSGRTRSWSGHPFGPRFASTMEHVFYYHFYYSDICCKNIYIYRYVVYLQLWTLHTLFVTLLPPNRREAPPIYVSELPSQNKRACMMKVAVWRLTHLKDGPDNFQSSDWCVQHQVLLILGKWLELCVSCNRRSIFQLHKRHRSEKRTRPETNATKNPGQAMAVVAKRENYDGADGWIVVNYIF